MNVCTNLVLQTQVGAEPRTRLLVNESANPQNFPIPSGSTSLAGAPLVSPQSVGPYGSLVIVTAEALIFADGFEAGNTGAWSLSLP